MAIATHRAGVVGPRVDRIDIVEDLGRNGHRGRRRDPDLAIAVLSPAPRGAIDQRAGMRTAGHHRGGRPRQRLDRDRRVALVQGEIAQLTVVVAPSAQDAAIVEPGARVLSSSIDLDGVGETTDLTRARTWNLRAVAELAESAVAPAPDRMIRPQGTAEPVAGRDPDLRAEAIAILGMESDPTATSDDTQI